MCVCVCPPQRWAVSLSLPPGSKEPPSSRSVIGQWSGVLDTVRCWLLQDVFQQMVEVRECHHIGERIRGERLSSRSCVVPPALKPKIPAPRHKPLYERRETWWRNARGKHREESLPCHTLGQRSALLAFRYLTFWLSFFLVFFLIFSTLPPLLLQCLYLSVCSFGSKFLMQHTVRSRSPQVLCCLYSSGLHSFPPEWQEFPLSQIPPSQGIRRQHIPLM